MSSAITQTGIFVATMTGLADMCAEEIESAISGAGTECQRFLMDGLGVDAFNSFGRIIIVSSTYGQGDIPDNGKALYESVVQGADLSGKDYAVFALGDMTYSGTFCDAGDQWDAALTGCGARRFVDVMRHDASSGTLAEDVAGEWAAGWVAELS